MDGVIIQVSGVQIRNKSDGQTSLMACGTRQRGPGVVLRCISSFSLFSFGGSRW